MASTKTDFSTLSLTEEEQALFDRFRESDTAVLTLAEYHVLRKRHFITANIGGEDPFFSDKDIQSGVCKLSQEGKEFRAYQAGVRKAEAKAEERYRQEQAKADTRDRRNYKVDVATLAVAIATLVVAVIALCHQLYS